MPSSVLDLARNTYLNLQSLRNDPRAEKSQGQKCDISVQSDQRSEKGQGQNCDISDLSDQRPKGKGLMSLMSLMSQYWPSRGK